MKAERNKRAIILEAEAAKQDKVLRAEGEKQSKILMAEGDKEARIREAEGIKAKELEAQGKHEQLKKLQKQNKIVLNCFVKRIWMSVYLLTNHLSH